MSLIRKIASKYFKIRERQNIVNAHHDVLKLDKENIADMRKHGFSFSESKLYDLKNNDYHKYISTYEAYAPRLKKNPYFIISDDKYLFWLVFGKYFDTPECVALIQEGEVCSLGEYAVNNENLYSFVLENKGMVVKDRQGYDGFDVYVFKESEGKLIYKGKPVEKCEFDNIIKKFSKGLIQQRVEQGEFENNLFKESVNTIRVITMRKKDSHEHEVVAALQRIGTKKSMPVDNFNQGGGSAIIDIQTGTVGSMTCMDSFDETGKRIFYDVHPDSGTTIKGAVIPGWQLIKETLVEKTKKLPFFDFIAWDVVLRNDGITVIETNMKSSLNLFQVHGGMKNVFLGKKYMEKGYIK